MKNEDEVAIMIAHKLMIKTRRKVKTLTGHHPHSCDCRKNLNKTLLVLIKMGRDVFNYRPEYYAAVILLADAISEMMTELEKLQSDEVIYL